jgi:hypothetical protein
MWLLVDEFNSQYWWNYPHFFETLSCYCTYRLFQLNYFWYLSTRMGPNPLFLSACSMGCNVHVTTRGWIQLAVLVELSHFFDTLEPLLYVQALPAQLFWYQLGWAQPFVPFQHAQWVVTYMWLLVDEFNSQYWWNYPISLSDIEPLLYVQALPAQLFWYLSTRWP